MPRDCTDHLIKLSLDVQSPGHRVSHTMTIKTKQARRKQAIKQITRKMQSTAVAVKPKKKKTPFADVGSIIGGGVGSMFGLPYAQGIGKWLGTGIGTIFGSGDYEMVGQNPSYNVLTNGAQIPKFSTTRQTNIVSHREYLGDITGTTAFTNRVYPINPGSTLTFPWLSTLAQCYQQYKIHGLIFEFRPLITDFVTSGAPGVVVMATNYNADEPAYTTKQAMENSEYAVSVKPTCNLMHGVECASNQTVLNELYVRPAGLASNLDLKFTDLGNFQFASQGNPTQLLGELWCSYTIEFFKPLLPNDVGGNVQSISTTRGGVTNVLPTGTVIINQSGDLAGFSLVADTLSFIGQPGNKYIIASCWGNIASPDIAITYPTLTFTNCVGVNSFFTDTQASTQSPLSARLTNLMNFNQVIACTATSPGLMTIKYSNTGIYPANSQLDLLVTQLSDDI